MAGRIVFFTGAGMSAESGVPTYRGRGGIWGQYRWEDFACQRAFEHDPARVLDFHEQRRAMVLRCEPHAGHRHLARLQQSREGIVVITQNTDGLHTRAGVRDVVELHGSLWRLRCPRHGKVEDLAGGPYARRDCAACGATLRPDIVWFEDPLEPLTFARAGQLIRECDTFVAVGTSAAVWPAAGLIHRARETGAHMVELNVDDTELSELFDERWRGAAGELLPANFPLPASGPAAGPP